MTDYEKLKLRELHLIASTLIELVNSTGHADRCNFDIIEQDYNDLDDCIERDCQIDSIADDMRKFEGRI